MTEHIPQRPPNSFRITLQLNKSEHRLDVILLNAIKNQNANLTLREISRSTFKDLFKNGKIQIKGQNAKPSSSIAAGITYIDILGYKS